MRVNRFPFALILMSWQKVWNFSTSVGKYLMWQRIFLLGVSVIEWIAMLESDRRVWKRWCVRDHTSIRNPAFLPKLKATCTRIGGGIIILSVVFWGVWSNWWTWLIDSVHPMEDLSIDASDADTLPSGSFVCMKPVESPELSSIDSSLWLVVRSVFVVGLNVSVVWSWGSSVTECGSLQEGGVSGGVCSSRSGTVLCWGVSWWCQGWSY